MVNNTKNYRNNEITKEEVIKLKEEMANIAEDFNKWLEDIAKKYGWDKDEVQVFIKWILM